MKTIIQILTAVLGLVVIVYSTLQSSHPIAVWSDFKAFESRVVQSGHADALKLGGEFQHESFDDLVTKVWNLKDDWRMIRYVGILLIFMSIIQFTAEGKRRNSEPGV